MTITFSALDELRSTLRGTLALPGDATWDDARAAWNLAVDQQPAAVVRAADAADVLATVDAARELGLRVAAQSTGHNAHPLGPLHDTVLLKTSAMRSVRIDPVRRIARVEAGTLWMDVTSAAAEHGLAALAGSAPDVGVIGYTLGGGISWLGRSLGLAANSVTAIDVVTADGQHRRVDADHDADLFWALRGGGGSFAVVTAMEFRLYPISELYAGVLFFPIERAAEVLPAWLRWTRTAPDAVTSIGRMLRFPPIPDLPPHLSGKSYVVVEAACRLDAAEADALLAPLRALGPVLDTFAVTPVTELGQLHMDPPAPVPGFGDGSLLHDIDDDAIDALLAVAGPGVESPLLSVELRHLGGALSAGRMAGGAVSGIDAEFAMFAVGFTPFPEAGVAVRAAVDGVQAAVAPWCTGGVYLNFAERPKAATALFGDTAHDRLRAIKTAYDPADLIRSNHPVRPA